MNVHDVTQGSPEWLALRRDYFTASEAPAMMGCSPYMTRTDLLHAKKTGLTPEIDERTQSRFDAGHAAEAAYRPLAEARIGQDLYPVTGSLEVEGLPLLSSFDGLTADDAIGFEHKLWNESVAESIAAGELLPDKYWQLEHELLVSGAEKVLFVTSDGTTDRCKWLYYHSQPERRAALIAGWKQFAIDLEAYVPQEYIPAPVAKAVTALPAVAVQVSGSIDVRDNFKLFHTALTDFIDNRLIREPKTDQDFADLDLQIKALKDAETAIKAAESNMLSQVESVDTAKRMMDTLHTMARDNRLMAEKLLAAKKESVKIDLVNEGRKALLDHVESLNKRLGKPYMPAAVADFQGAIKGKRTIDSLREAVSVTLANAKIAASATADRIELNLKSYIALAHGLERLFPDSAQLVLKEADDFVRLVNARIAEHNAAEQKRLESERERIRAEEAKKLADAAEAKRKADEAAALAAATPVSQPKPEEPAQAAPDVAPVSPVMSKLDVIPDFIPVLKMSDQATAFLSHYQWPSQAARNTARSVLIEFEKFCASQRMKAAA